MIKVRIYSSVILANLGSADGLSHIQDMMVIKNRSIQRSILNLNRGINSLEFSFFIISLLKIEYGISNDIISIISHLSDDDLKEINGFIINIFRKYQAPELETIGAKAQSKIVNFPDLKEEVVTSFHIDIIKKEQINNIVYSIEYNIDIEKLLNQVIKKHDGIITKMSEFRTTAFFRDPIKAVDASKEIMKGLKKYNKNKNYAEHFHFLVNLITDSIQIINEEILSYREYKLINYNDILLSDLVVCDQKTYEAISEKYHGITIPYLKTIQLENYYKILDTINFKEIATEIKEQIIIEEKEKIEEQKQIEADMKKLRLRSRPSSSVTLANDLDNIGKKLQVQLEDLERYIIRRSTDRELNKHVRRMIQDTNNLYTLEVSKLIID